MFPRIISYNQTELNLYFLYTFHIIKTKVNYILFGFRLITKENYYHFNRVIVLVKLSEI